MTTYFACVLVLTGIALYVTLCIIAATVEIVREGLLRRKRGGR